MRVLYFNYEFPPLGGGAGNASFYLLREYAKIPNLMIDFVTSSVDDKYYVLKMGENITIHRLPIGKKSSNIHYQTKGELVRYTWRAYKFSRKLAKENHYDLTHSFFSVPCGFISMLLKFEFKLPYIVSLRGSDVPYYSERFTTLYKFITPIIRQIWNKAYFVIANSQGLKDLALISKPNKEIGIIYNGIDVYEFLPKLELKSAEEFRIVCVSRVTPRKGIRFLVQAFDILSKRYSQLRINIVGDGNERQSLQQLVRSMGIEDKVTFSLNISHDEIAQYYQKSNIFVLPSLNEGMSNTMLEALACGLPIVATDTGGTRELVEDGENGMIVKMGEYNDLMEKIERFLLDKTLEEKMGKLSRQRALQLSWEKVAKQYVDLYEKTAKLRMIRDEQ